MSVFHVFLIAMTFKMFPAFTFLLLQIISSYLVFPCRLRYMNILIFYTVYVISNLIYYIAHISVCLKLFFIVVVFLIL